MEIGISTFAELTPDPHTGTAINAEQRLHELVEEIVARRPGRPRRLRRSASTTAPTSPSPRPPWCSAARRAHTTDPPHQRRHRAQLRRPGARVPDFATLDLLSAGRRRSWPGAARSSSRSRCSATTCDDYDELFAEKLELLLAMRDQEHVTWSGRLPRRRSSGAGVYPRPLQEPLPDLDRRRGDPAVGPPRRHARAAAGGRDHRRAPGALRRVRPSSTARAPGRRATTPSSCRSRYQLARLPRRARRRRAVSAFYARMPQP